MQDVVSNIMIHENSQFTDDNNKEKAKHSYTELHTAL